MTKEQAKKEIKKEIKKIEKEFDIASWDYLDVSRMDSEEAFNRGCYRTLQHFLNYFIK